MYPGTKVLKIYDPCDSHALSHFRIKYQIKSHGLFPIFSHMKLGKH